MSERRYPSQDMTMTERKQQLEVFIKKQLDGVDIFTPAQVKAALKKIEKKLYAGGGMNIIAHDLGFCLSLSLKTSLEFGLIDLDEIRREGMAEQLEKIL